MAELRAAQSSIAHLKNSLGELGRIAGLAALGESLRRGVAEGIRYNAKLEEIRRGLAAVKGSAGLAAASLAELQRAEGQGLFDVAELGAAARQLEVMTGGALAAGSGLRLVMDVAAGTDAPLASVADALGRVYGQMRAGDPELGRGMQQLVMMGALNAATKNQIEGLARSGKTAEEQWTALTGALGRFNGQSAAAAGTLKGLRFQLGQAFEEVLGGATEGLFGDLKTALAGLVESLRSGPAGAALRELATAAATAASAFVRLVGFLGTSSVTMSTFTAAVRALAAAWIGLKNIQAVQGMAAWIANAWKSVSATTASTAALNAETQAVLANAAAKRTSNLADAFAPPKLPGKGSILRDPVSGRFLKPDNAGGTMRTGSYTAGSLAATLAALDARAVPAGLSFGQKFAGAFKSAFGQIAGNLGLTIAAGLGGWYLGKYLRRKGTGEENEADFDRAHANRVRDDEAYRGYVERAKAIGSVAEKMELLKQLEQEVASQRGTVQNSSASNIEKETANTQIATLLGLRRYISGLDEAAIKTRALARARSENRQQNEPQFWKTQGQWNREDVATRRDRAIAGATNPIEQLRIVRAYIQETEGELKRIDLGAALGENNSQKFGELVERANSLREVIKDLRGKELGLVRENEQGARAREELALELQLFRARAAGDTSSERSAERTLAIRKKTAELLPLYASAAEAAQKAQEYVDAERAGQRPNATALTPQASGMERVGLFVGGVTNTLQTRATDAVVKSREILANMLALMREGKSAGGAVWGAA